MAIISPLPWPNEYGVLTGVEADQLFGRDHVRAQLEAGRWQRPAPHVVVTHNGPLTQHQVALVALHRCPFGAALAGLTSLGFDGLAGFAEPLPYVVLPVGADRQAGVVCHWSRMLSSRDVHPKRQPRRTRPPRSAVDAASWQTNERRARAIILAAVQQRLVRPGDLRDVVDSRGPCRHRALIKESILDAEGGIQSLPERDFEIIRRRHHLPEPSRQSVRRRKDGKYYLDVEWQVYGVGCEIHGIPHLRVLQWDADLDRANEIAITGPRMLVFSSYATRRQQDRVGSQLDRMLRRQGWPG